MRKGPNFVLRVHCCFFMVLVLRVESLFCHFLSDLQEVK